MLISQPVTSCLTSHGELCMSRLPNDQSRRISIYRLQWRPSFGFEFSVSSTLMTSGDPVVMTTLQHRTSLTLSTYHSTSVPSFFTHYGSKRFTFDFWDSRLRPSL